MSNIGRRTPALQSGVYVRPTKKIGIVLLLLTLLLIVAWIIVYLIIDIIIQYIFYRDILIAVAGLGGFTGVIVTFDLLWLSAWKKGRQTYEVIGVLLKRKG